MQWDFSANELVDFMNACIDRGLTTFDTTEIYGRTACASLMGDAFRLDSTIRTRIELVSKTGIFSEAVGDVSFGYYDTSRNSCSGFQGFDQLLFVLEYGMFIRKFRPPYEGRDSHTNSACAAWNPPRDNRSFYMN